MMEGKATEVTELETIFQEMRKKEMEILLRAGFPDETKVESAQSALEIFQEIGQKEIEKEKTTEVSDVETIFQEMRKKEMEILLRAGFPDETKVESAQSAMEIFQEIRQKEIEILLRAGFPDTDHRSENLSSISGTTLTQSISEYSTITELDTSFGSWDVEESQALNDQLGEVDSLISEADQEKRSDSFMKSLICFTCCFKGRAPLAKTKKQNDKYSRRPGLVRRLRDFVLRTVLRRGRNKA